MVPKYSSVSTIFLSQCVFWRKSIESTLSTFAQQLVFCPQSHLFSEGLTKLMFNLLLPPLPAPPWSLFTFETVWWCASVWLSSGSDSSGGSNSFKILSNKNVYWRQISTLLRCRSRREVSNWKPYFLRISKYGSFSWHGTTTFHKWKFHQRFSVGW